jgi:hypothetical protein
MNICGIDCQKKKDIKANWFTVTWIEIEMLNNILQIVFRSKIIEFIQRFCGGRKKHTASRDLHHTSFLPHQKSWRLRATSANWTVVTIWIGGDAARRSPVMQRQICIATGGCR